jgi:hypothetical protein
MRMESPFQSSLTSSNRIVLQAAIGTPFWGWTRKIRVHAFTCVLALTLSSLLQRTVYQKGLDLSLPRLFDLLGGIRETLVIYPKRPGQRHPSTARALSTLSAEQEQLVTVLQLRRYQ